MNRDREMSVSESELYFKTEKPAEIAPLQKSVEEWIRVHYPMAVISFSPPETVFEKLFVTGEADIVAELYTRNKSEAPEASVLHKIEQQIDAKTGRTPVGITFDNQLNITIDRQKLLLYNVDYSEVYRLLKTAFKENEVATLRSYQQYLPIALAGEEQTVNEVLQKTLVNTVPDTEGNVRYIPLQSLVRVTPGEDLKTITAGKNGEYIPFSFYDVDNAGQLMEDVKKEVDADWDIDFSGSFFSNRQMLNELVVILFISILLMYFILAAQFESFLHQRLHPETGCHQRTPQRGSPAYGSHTRGRTASPAPYHHDIINDNIRNGSAAFHIRYGKRTAKAALHRHDLGHADRYGSQSFRHTAGILVHLSQT